MEAVKEIVHITNPHLSLELDLPDSFRSQDVEVLILPLGTRAPKASPTRFYGVMSQSDEELEQELNRLRNEWDRPNDVSS